MEAGSPVCGADIRPYETELYRFLAMRHPAILATLPDTKRIDDRLTAVLTGSLDELAGALNAFTGGGRCN